jgi:hypothetical protein
VTTTKEEVIEALERFDTDYWPQSMLTQSLDKDFEEKLYRIFGGATGGYLDGEEYDYFYSWRLNGAKRLTRDLREGEQVDCVCDQCAAETGDDGFVRPPKEMAVEEVFEDLMRRFRTMPKRDYEFTPEQLRAWIWAIEWWFDNA